CCARAAFAFDLVFGAALVSLPAAVFGLCGAPFFPLARFVAAERGGAADATGAVTVAAVSWVSLWVMLFSILFGYRDCRILCDIGYPRSAPLGAVNPFTGSGDGRRVLRLAAGPVGNQICSPVRQ